MLLSVCATVGLGRRLKKADGKKSKHKVSDDAVGSQAFPQLVLFDDSLHNRWRDASTNGLVVDFRASADGAPPTPNARDGGVPCGRTIRATFGTQSQELVLAADDPIVVPSGSAPALLSFSFALSSASAAAGCTGEPAKGACPADAHACVSARLAGTWKRDSWFVPLCGGDGGAWQAAHVPLRAFALERFDELIFVAGGAAATQYGAKGRGRRFGGGLTLSIDELYLASSRPPLAGDAPPSYGASDHAIVRSSWAEGVRPRGAAVALKRSNNPHYCSYMSSEQRQTTEVCGDGPRNSAQFGAQFQSSDRASHSSCRRSRRASSAASATATT